jgi:glycosyltransferase involved in cell wall biosynthesis
VYPSIFEGFGLPPLEAMACGTPVVTSNTSSLPEVVGEAGLMVDPLDAEALAGAMARVLGDEDLRARLAVRGPEQAVAFSWEATARIIRDVYHGCGDGAG